MIRRLLTALALLALPSVASASPRDGYVEPVELCRDLAEAAYQLAVAQGNGLPDGPYERAMANCDYRAYRAHLIASRSVSLNELVAFDHDGDSWLFEGVSTPSENEMDRQDAVAHAQACPNGRYDATNEVDICD